MPCQWATDQEFQQLLDAIVSGGIAVRETGERGGEWYRGGRAMQNTLLTPEEVSDRLCISKRSLYELLRRDSNLPWFVLGRAGPLSFD